MNNLCTKDNFTELIHNSTSSWNSGSIEILTQFAFNIIHHHMVDFKESLEVKITENLRIIFSVYNIWQILNSYIKHGFDLTLNHTFIDLHWGMYLIWLRDIKRQMHWFRVCNPFTTSEMIIQ
mgnify:CR=1 FL=1